MKTNRAVSSLFFSSMKFCFAFLIHFNLSAEVMLPKFSTKRMFHCCSWSKSLETHFNCLLFILSWAKFIKLLCLIQNGFMDGCWNEFVWALKNTSISTLCFSQTLSVKSSSFSNFFVNSSVAFLSLSIRQLVLLSQQFPKTVKTNRIVCCFFFPSMRFCVLLFLSSSFA